jgi:hypothetical protein
MTDEEVSSLHTPYLLHPRFLKSNVTKNASPRHRAKIQCLRQKKVSCKVVGLGAEYLIHPTSDPT